MTALSEAKKIVRESRAARAKEYNQLAYPEVYRPCESCGVNYLMEDFKRGRNYYMNCRDCHNGRLR